MNLAIPVSTLLRPKRCRSGSLVIRAFLERRDDLDLCVSLISSSVSRSAVSSNERVSGFALATGKAELSCVSTRRASGDEHEP
jgi:hypothetical protein